MDSKSWWASKTIWGGIITMMGAVADMVMKGGPNPENIAALGGGVISIFGRAVASTTIK